MAWFNLLGSSTDSLVTQFIVTSGIVQGNYYQFRIRAKNKWGWSPVSPIFSIQASSVPDKVAVPVTSITSDGQVQITWTRPNDRSNAITQYKIEIQSATDSSLWQESVATCDGSNAAIVTARVCKVPMETILEAPYSYTLNQVIAVRVSAFNMNGWGLASSANTAGAVAKTKPAAMLAVLRGAETTEKEVQVTWVTQTLDAETGGSPVLSYNLQWDQGTGNELSWVDLIGFPTNYL